MIAAWGAASLLMNNPLGRFRGYLGVARAAAAVGDDAKAARSYAKMMELAADGGAPRPELAEARQFVARK